MGSKLGKAALALAVVAGMGALEVPAGAHNASYPSSISISYSGGSFSGEVGSPNDDCKGGRLVNIVQEFGKGKGKDHKRVGKTSTSNSGHWSFSLPNADGHYYAHVVNRVRKQYGHHHKCKGRSSQTIRVRP